MHGCVCACSAQLSCTQPAAVAYCGLQADGVRMVRAIMGRRISGLAAQAAGRHRKGGRVDCIQNSVPKRYLTKNPEHKKQKQKQGPKGFSRVARSVKEFSYGAVPTNQSRTI